MDTSSLIFNKNSREAARGIDLLLITCPAARKNSSLQTECTQAFPAGLSPSVSRVNSTPIVPMQCLSLCIGCVKMPDVLKALRPALIEKCRIASKAHDFCHRSSLLAGDEGAHRDEL